jgi:hypothetical protein
MLMTSFNVESMGSIIENPVVDGESKLGARELRRGPLNFFLKPGETIQAGHLNESTSSPPLHTHHFVFLC